MSRSSRSSSGHGRTAKHPKRVIGDAPAEVFIPAPLLAAKQTPPPLLTPGMVLTAYVILLCGGFALLRSPYATVNGSELTVDRAAFTVMNAVTLAGFEQSIGLGELRVAGQIAVFFLIVAGTLLGLTVGGVLVARIVQLPFSNRKIAIGAAIAAAAAAAIGGASELNAGEFSAGAFNGVSALGNSGMYLGHLGDAVNPHTQLVLLPLAVAGGLSLPVLMDLGESLRGRRTLSQHSLSVFSMSASIYIAGVVLLLLTQLARNAPMAAPGTMLATCSTAALNSRSAGFPFTPIEQFTRASQWVLMGLMVIGAAPGGTGGGLKVTTPLVLWRGVRRCYYAQEPGRAVAVAAVWTVAYLMLVFSGLVVLLICEPQVPGDRLLLLTISAASSVGLAHDPVSMVGPGLFALGAIAVLGRLMPLALLFWMARCVRGADVAVG